MLNKSDVISGDLAYVGVKILLEVILNSGGGHCKLTTKNNLEAQCLFFCRGYL